MARFDFASHMYISLPAVIIVIGIVIISTSVLITQHTEVLSERDFSITQLMLTDHLKERAVHFFQVNLSIHKVARVIGSVLDKTSLSSTTIDKNVASSLFMALRITQMASQISFVRA
ncbi:uncharacterized protein LOC110029854 isoform X2 [Phalaenopsis equestris]|uniref:uncharacterized protein LOC110029854 isoform X2 n=1 Tax=Phalaenopsis equestris TaxID=78828 RepID=UPI0009E23D23|nr:uncharacterized protein LOC110029854 isoform X2 [Phalaenopsis equestris]